MVFKDYYLANGNILSVMRYCKGKTIKYLVQLFDIDKLEEKTLYASEKREDALAFFNTCVATA